MNSGTCQTEICNKGVCTPSNNGEGFQCHCLGSELYPEKFFKGGGRTVSQRPNVKVPLSEIDYNEVCELRSRGFSKNSFLTFPALRQRHRLHIKFMWVPN